MAEKIVVKAELRNGRGTKNVNRRLRSEGKIPFVVYGGGGDSVSGVADLKDLAAILRTEASVNTVFSLDIAGGGTNDVIFQDRQIDPVTGRLIHADLRRMGVSAARRARSMTNKDAFWRSARSPTAVFA